MELSLRRKTRRKISRVNGAKLASKTTREKNLWGHLDSIWFSNSIAYQYQTVESQQRITKIQQFCLLRIKNSWEWEIFLIDMQTSSGSFTQDVFLASHALDQFFMSLLGLPLSPKLVTGVIITKASLSLRLDNDMQLWKTQKLGATIKPASSHELCTFNNSDIILLFVEKVEWYGRSFYPTTLSHMQFVTQHLAFYGVTLSVTTITRWMRGLVKALISS